VIDCTHQLRWEFQFQMSLFKTGWGHFFCNLIEPSPAPKKYAQVVMIFLVSYVLACLLAERASELGDKVFAKIPAHLANNMFQTEFGRFRSVDDDKVVLLRVTKVRKSHPL
jgi:hypothetical protein